MIPVGNGAPIPPCCHGDTGHVSAAASSSAMRGREGIIFGTHASIRTKGDRRRHQVRKPGMLASMMARRHGLPSQGLRGASHIAGVSMENRPNAGIRSAALFLSASGGLWATASCARRPMSRDRVGRIAGCGLLSLQGHTHANPAARDCSGARAPCPRASHRARGVRAAAHVRSRTHCRVRALRCRIPSMTR